MASLRWFVALAAGTLPAACQQSRRDLLHPADIIAEHARQLREDGTSGTSPGLRELQSRSNNRVRLPGVRLHPNGSRPILRHGGDREEPALLTSHGRASGDSSGSNASPQRSDRGPFAGRSDPAQPRYQSPAQSGGVPPIARSRPRQLSSGVGGGATSDAADSGSGGPPASLSRARRLGSITQVNATYDVTTAASKTVKILWEPSSGYVAMCSGEWYGGCFFL